MRRYLVEHGIPDGRIILEDRSTTTEENVRFSKEIVDARGGGKVALVSSNYHVYRCLRIAREEGLRCTGIGAHVALYFWPSALIREFVAIFVTHRSSPGPSWDTRCSSPRFSWRTSSSPILRGKRSGTDGFPGLRSPFLRFFVHEHKTTR